MGADGQNLSSEQVNQFRAQTGNLLGQTDNLANQAADAASRYQTNFSQFAPTLNSNFSQFNPGLQTQFPGAGANGLDSYSQAVLGQGQQDLNNKTAGVQSQIRSQFGRTNPNLAGVLQAQAGMQGQIQANPLHFQAATAQRGRELQEFQANNQARLTQSQEMARLQQLGNQTGLQQAEIGANLQNLGNSALGQQTQLAALPAQARQNLIAVLGALSQIKGYTGQ